jgi:hypothetical protein
LFYLRCCPTSTSLSPVPVIRVQHSSVVKKNPNKQKTRQLEGEQEWKRDTRLEWEKRGTARDESSHHLQLPHFFISVINGFL